jgi:hypothetical protein
MTRTPIARRTAGIVLAALALGIVTTTAAARPIEPYSAVPVGPQQSTSSNPSTAQDSGIPPVLHRVHGSELAAFNAARQQALAKHVPPSGRYSTADVNTYAAVKAPTVSTPGNGFDWGDAAIGAAAATVIALMVGAGTVAARQRSQPRLP